MNRLQIKYCAIQGLHQVGRCALVAYIAVLLQFKGMTNTDIGIVTGGGCFATVFLSAQISGLIARVPGLTMRRMIQLLCAVLTASFLALAYLDLPRLVALTLGILAFLCVNTFTPLLSMMGTNYIKQGRPLDYGSARGTGSITYASTAIIMGWLVGIFDPRLAALVYLGAAASIVLVLGSMPDFETAEEPEQSREKVSVFSVLQGYPEFFLILLSYGFMYTAATAISTYLINIVRSVGGDTSFYGLIAFLMSASELPFMIAAGRLMKKHSTLRLISLGLSLYVGRNLLLCLAFGKGSLLVGSLFQGASYGLLTPLLTLYVSRRLRPREQLMGQSLITIFSNGIAAALGNLLGGVLQDQFGMPAMVGFVCGCTALGLALALRLLREK